MSAESDAASRAERGTSRAAPEVGAGAPPPRTGKTWIYHVGLALCWVLVRLWHRARIRGREHLPRSGGFLVVANHQSLSDIPLLGIVLRHHAVFVYRESLRRSRFMAWFTDGCRGIPIRRGTADRAALRAIQAHLETGSCVVVFPEGTRSPDGRLAPFRGGVLVAARKAGVPLVPVAIRGGSQAWPRDRVLPRFQRMSAEVAPPIDPKDPHALERLREAIAARVGDGRFGGGPAPEEALPTQGPGR